MWGVTWSCCYLSVLLWVCSIQCLNKPSAYPLYTADMQWVIVIGVVLYMLYLIHLIQIVVRLIPWFEVCNLLVMKVDLQLHVVAFFEQSNRLPPHEDEEIVEAAGIYKCWWWRCVAFTTLPVVVAIVLMMAHIVFIIHIFITTIVKCSYRQLTLMMSTARWIVGRWIFIYVHVIELLRDCPGLYFWNAGWCSEKLLHDLWRAPNWRSWHWCLERYAKDCHILHTMKMLFWPWLWLNVKISKGMKVCAILNKTKWETKQKGHTFCPPIVLPWVHISHWPG